MSRMKKSDAEVMSSLAATLAAKKERQKSLNSEIKALEDKLKTQRNRSYDPIRARIEKIVKKAISVEIDSSDFSRIVDQFEKTVDQLVENIKAHAAKSNAVKTHVQNPAPQEEAPVVQEQPQAVYQQNIDSAQYDQQQEIPPEAYMTPAQQQYGYGA